jgi:sugar lactone lactonase YvrE
MNPRSIFFLTLLAAPLAAQLPRTGDWMVTDSTSAGGGVYRVVPSTGVSNWIARLTLLNGLEMAPGNRDLVLVQSFPVRNVIRMTPQGTTTPIATFGNLTHLISLALDQDGTWVAGGADGLYRVDPGTGTTTQLAFTFGALFDVTIDQDTGDYYGVNWVGMLAGQGKLFRIDRRTHAVTTIVAGLGFTKSIDFEPRTGAFIVAANTAFEIMPPPVRRISRTGASVTVHATFPPAFPSAVAVNQETGNILAGGADSLGLMTPAGALLTSYALPLNNDHVTFYGSAKITGSGPATPGSTYTYQLSFPDSPGRPYVGAMSFGLRPGIALGDGTGRVINLDPTSPLFLASLGGIPSITSGYAGVLDAQGNATASIAIQPGTPPDIRWHFSAVVLDPAAPSGIVTANTWSFSTN